MKNSKIEIFTFERNEIRILTTTGKEPMFVAKDIELLLGYDSKNTTKSCYLKYKRYSFVNQDGQISELDFLNESDVESLGIRSKCRDTASRFGKWLQDEVLSSFNNTDDIEVADVNDLKKNQVEAINIVPAAVAAAKAFGFTDKDVFLYADIAVKAITGISPLVLLKEGVKNEEKFLTTANLGKRLGISTVAMNSKLAQLGLQRRKWQGHLWSLTDKGKKYGVSFDATTYESWDGCVDQRIIWKEDNILNFLAPRLAPEKSDPIIFKATVTSNSSALNTTVDELDAML